MLVEYMQSIYHCLVVKTNVIQAGMAAKHKTMQGVIHNQTFYFLEKCSIGNHSTKNVFDSIIKQSVL